MSLSINSRSTGALLHGDLMNYADMELLLLRDYCITVVVQNIQAFQMIIFRSFLLPMQGGLQSNFHGSNIILLLMSHSPRHVSAAYMACGILIPPMMCSLLKCC